MKRILAAMLTTIAISGLLVAATPTGATAAPLPTCNSFNSTQNNSSVWNWSTTFRWHYTDWLTTSNSCDGRIFVTSGGWRFNYYQCGEMWVRRPNSDGTTYVVPGSRRVVCGGWTVQLISRIAGGRRFRIEAVSHNSNDRESSTWPIAKGHY
jgi:hypothetical protein